MDIDLQSAYNEGYTRYLYTATREDEWKIRRHKAAGAGLIEVAREQAEYDARVVESAVAELKAAVAATVMSKADVENCQAAMGMLQRIADSLRYPFEEK